MTELLLSLILAHILGDFVFQPDKWVKDKEARKIKSPFLYYHVLVHAVLTMALSGFEMRYAWLYAGLPLAHLLIDVGKIYLSPVIRNKTTLFFMDQGLHMLSLILACNFYHTLSLDTSLLFAPQAILLFIFILAVTFVSSVSMKMLMHKWSAEINNEEKSLHQAGMYIGMLERLLIFFFVLINQYAGIGFLLAAKSVFRFGDLSKSKDRKLTEYILIGTLTSFGLAILLGELYKYCQTLLA